MKKHLNICYVFLAALLLLIVYKEYTIAGGMPIQELFARKQEIKGKQVFSASGQTFSLSVPDSTDTVVTWSGIVMQEGAGHASPDNYRPIADTISFACIDVGPNMLFPSLYTNNKGGLNWQVNDDLSISIRGTCTETGALNIMTLPLEKGTYTLQGVHGCGSVTIEVVDSEKRSLGRLSSDTKSMQIEIPQDGEYTVRYFHIASETPIDAVSYPMLTKGTEVYNYKTTVKNVTVNLPEHFGGGTISSDGTVTVTHYRTALSSKSALSNPSMENDGTYRYGLQDYANNELKPALGEWNVIYDMMATAVHPVAYCSLYNTNWAYTIAVADNNNHLIVRLPFSKAKDARNWFDQMEEAGTPVEIIYKLQTPLVLTKQETFSADLESGNYIIIAPHGTLSVVGYETNKNN